MRARNLKPSLFKNEVLGTADALYTVLFEGLWCLADREGRLEDRPLRIKAEVFPYRDGIDTGDMLNWLAEHGFIVRYVVRGLRIIQILTFSEHQHPHKNEVASTLPSMEVVDSTDGGTKHNQGQNEEQPRHEVLPAKNGIAPADSLLLTPDSPFTALAPQVQPPAETSETPKRQTSATSKRKTPKSPEIPLPEDFGLDPELEQYTLDHLPAVDPKALMEKYRLQAKNKQWRYADWRLAFMTYVRNCQPNSGHFAAGRYPKRGAGGIQWQ